MWVVREKTSGEFYLAYDPTARRNGKRGLWEWIGAQKDLEIEKYVRANQQEGYIVLKDNEGGVRALILED